MSVLRNIEHKIEGLFEGVFGRAFRTHVQPVELARKLVKEMEDHRVISVSRVARQPPVRRGMPAIAAGFTETSRPQRWPVCQPCSLR